MHFQKFLTVALFAFFLAIAGIVNAAEIAATYSLGGDRGTITWPNITSGDTAGEANINLPEGFEESHRGWRYRLFINGTPDDVDMTLVAGKTSGALKSINSSAMPNGLRFNSASDYATSVCLLNGDIVDFTFTSAAGASTNVTAILEPIGACW